MRRCGCGCGLGGKDTRVWGSLCGRTWACLFAPGAFRRPDRPRRPPPRPALHSLLVQAKASGAGKAVKNMPKGAGKGGAKSTGR